MSNDIYKTLEDLVFGTKHAELTVTTPSFLKRVMERLSSLETELTMVHADRVGIQAGTSTVHDNMHSKCRWCGDIHGPMCPHVEEMEFYENGQVKRVKYRPSLFAAVPKSDYIVKP